MLHQFRYLSSSLRRVRHLHSRPALPIGKVQSLYLQRAELKGSGNIFTFFFLVAIKDLFSMVYRK